MLASFGLLALAAATATAQDVTDFDRFRLFNHCEPMHLVILGPYDDWADTGLTKERLQFAMESRLRSARLFKADTGTPFLQVGVDVFGRAFATNLAYNKTLFDSVSGAAGFAATWSIRQVGTHGGSTRVH